MIEEILPATVACAEAGTDVDVALEPAEAAAVARAIASRRAEFATGRACARIALSRLGIPPTAIGVGSSGAPLWPPGVVGSITHCAGYRAAAVASVADLRTIGIDAERDQPLPDGVLEVVSSPDERARLPKGGEVSWDRVLFSAKESLYKAWFPLTGRWLGFEEAVVDIDAGDGSFTAWLVDPEDAEAATVLHGARGRWSAQRGFVLTALASIATATDGAGATLPEIQHEHGRRIRLVGVTASSPSGSEGPSSPMAPPSRRISAHRRRRSPRPRRDPLRQDRAEAHPALVHLDRRCPPPMVIVDMPLALDGWRGARDKLVRSIYDHSDAELAVEFVTQLGTASCPPEIRQLGRTISK